eukprot:scaffold2782_cov182-Amphora_coffeaeformis.AAC.28
MTNKHFRGALAEFVGMTLFVYVGTGAAISTGEQLASSAAPTAASVARVLPISFAFGVSILVNAYSFGHISGGHFNPAVTYCLFLVGECELAQLLYYFLAQFGGATLGSLLLWASVSNMSEGRGDVLDQVVGNPPFALGANGLNPALNEGNGFLLEFMGTLVLCVTVVMTCLHKNSLAQGAPNMAPLAIGFSVFLAHVVLVPLTGCGINPARTAGPAIVNTIAGSNVWASTYWIYFVGPFAASMIAALIYKVLFAPEDDENEDANVKEEEGKPHGPETAMPDIAHDVEMNRLAQRIHERLRK